MESQILGNNMMETIEDYTNTEEIRILIQSNDYDLIFPVKDLYKGIL